MGKPLAFDYTEKVLASIPAKDNIFSIQHDMILVEITLWGCYTVQKMKFSIKELFSKCDQIRYFMQICSHLLKKSLMENFI